jgi:hypothetical protein
VNQAGMSPVDTDVSRSGGKGGRAGRLVVTLRVQSIRYRIIWIRETMGILGRLVGIERFKQFFFCKLQKLSCHERSKSHGCRRPLPAIARTFTNDLRTADQF